MSPRSRWTYDTIDEASPLVSRFSIALLSSVLLGMATGYAMPKPIPLLAGSAAVLGMFFYAYRIWLVSRMVRESSVAMQSRVESRLNIFADMKGLPTPSEPDLEARYLSETLS